MANEGFWVNGQVWFSTDNLNAMLLQFGESARRGDFGQRGRVHFDTDEGVESYDTGSGWVNKEWGAGAYRDDSITQAKMANNSVGTSQMRNNNVTQSKLSSNSVGTNQLRNGEVTDSKIDSMNANKLTGTISGSRFPSSRPYIYQSDSSPSSGTGINGSVWLEY